MYKNIIIQDQGLVSGSSVDVDYHSDAAASGADIRYNNVYIIDLQMRN